MKIKYMNLCLTNRCNLACVMCDIWQEKDKIDLSLQIVEEILQANCLDQDLDITLTGGELFLHPGLWSITEAVLAKNPRWLRGISTNGTKTQDVGRFLNDFSDKLTKDFSFHISLDGIICHDTQRGRSLERILKTIQLIKEFRPSFAIKIKFTITAVNYKDIIPTFRFCQDNALDFRLKLAEYAPSYTNRVNLQDFAFDDEARRSIVRDLREVQKEKIRFRDENALFIAESIEHLLGHSKPKICMAPFQRVFIMSEGNVYSCLHLSKIGNLSDDDLDSIWHSQTAEAHRKRVLDEGCVCGVSYHGA